MEFKYKKALNLEKRIEKFNKVKTSTNDKIQIICEKDPKSDIIEMEKTKFLVNPEMNVSQFETLIRKKLKLNKESALFVVVNDKHNIIVNLLFSEIYEKFKDEDGFLYIAYANEQIWGF